MILAYYYSPRALLFNTLFPERQNAELGSLNPDLYAGVCDLLTNCDGGMVGIEAAELFDESHEVRQT